MSPAYKVKTRVSVVSSDKMVESELSEKQLLIMIHHLLGIIN